MAVFKLPLHADLPNYEFRIDLDGTTYLASFRWNGRMEVWIMDLKDANDSPILMGMPILQGVEILKRIPCPCSPQGSMIVVNLETDYVEADRDNLGSNVLVVYEPVIQ